MGAEVYFSYSGKHGDRELWAYVDGEAKEIRGAAVMLYQDIRTRQEEAGNEPTAGVWIGDRKYEPSLSELEEHATRAKLVLESEKDLPDEVAEIAMTISTDELAALVEECPPFSVAEER